MNRKEILSAISELSMCQGFYGRLLSWLRSGSDESERYLEAMEMENFGDVVDMVMWLEC